MIQSGLESYSLTFAYGRIVDVDKDDCGGVFLSTEGADNPCVFMDRQQVSQVLQYIIRMDGTEDTVLRNADGIVLAWRYIGDGHWEMAFNDGRDTVCMTADPYMLTNLRVAMI